MDTNDLIRRIRYAASLDDAHCVRLIEAGGGDANLEMAQAWRLREAEPGYRVCPTAAVHALLDGLIEERRGPRDAGAALLPSTASASVWPSAAQRVAARAAVQTGKSVQQQGPVGQAFCDNNAILKQLRIAFTLRAEDVQALVRRGGGSLTAAETSALFRKPGARNYRRCGDQVLRQCLTGLARLRESERDDDDPARTRNFLTADGGDSE